jgi:hypothetical protein
MLLEAEASIEVVRSSLLAVRAAVYAGYAPGGRETPLCCDAPAVTDRDVFAYGARLVTQTIHAPLFVSVGLGRHVERVEVVPGGLHVPFPAAQPATEGHTVVELGIGFHLPVWSRLGLGGHARIFLDPRYVFTSATLAAAGAAWTVGPTIRL